MKPPSTLSKGEWPPNYTKVWQWRQAQIKAFRKDPALLASAHAYYATRPVEFINHWIDTFNPRNDGVKVPKRIPMILFERQEKLVQAIMACIDGKGSLMCEKSRDQGATYVCCGVSVWGWRYVPGFTVGWGSRKQELVDRIGDQSSIFEKIRTMIRNLPREFLPYGFVDKECLTFMRVIHPDKSNGASITGEVGDNIGRGGRTTVYFKDESAHYARPELVEAALGENTDTQVDISSVNGPGNVFHRRREVAIEWHPGKPVVRNRANLFVMDWRDNPLWSEQRYKEKREKAESEGLMHKFAQEVDRDYYSALQAVVIKIEWIEAAIDAHIRLGVEVDGQQIAGFDPFDEGADEHALALRRGILLTNSSGSKLGDPAEGVRWAISQITGKCSIQYDSVGIGAGAKVEANRLKEVGLLPQGISFVPWNAGARVESPDQPVIDGDSDSPLNKDFYDNLKAQAWWDLRKRFERTYKAVTLGESHSIEDLISISSDIEDIQTLKKELTQVTYGQSRNLKLLINKTPEGTKSPNRADAVVMCYFPLGQSYDLESMI